MYAEYQVHKNPKNKKMIKRSGITNSVLHIITLFIASGVLMACKQETGNNPEKFFRGNTHTHAEFSDSHNKNDVPTIARWYKKAGYDFLVISEHNDRVSKKRVFCHDEASDPPDFIVLCGLELSNSRHVTALGIESFIGDEISLQDGVSKTLAAGGVPILNHPQNPVETASDFIATDGLNHLEVFNGNSPKDTQANEMLWDSILSSPVGRTVFAVAADDNHYKKSNVGRGWIMVNSPALTKEDIKESIRAGNFYASTGIILKKYKIKGKSIVVDSKNGKTVLFIGKYGIVLKRVDGSGGEYNIQGNELYVRVKITGKKGKSAWMQPVFIKDMRF